MKKLPVSYRKNTDQFHLIERRGDVCAYSQSDENGIYAYEVFKVQKLRERHINGRIIEAREVTPSDEQWGEKGYSCRNLDRAMQRMAEMYERSVNRKHVHTISTPVNQPVWLHGKKNKTYLVIITGKSDCSMEVVRRIRIY